MVLIERGSEVGGDDVRTGIGTVARIIEAAELDDGRWVLGVAGTRRIRVRRWLPDQPYPCAEVDELPDEETAVPLSEPYEEAASLLRQVLGLRAELGEATPPATVELTDEPVLGTFQLAALSPLGPADRQRVLAAGGPDARLDLVRSLLREEADFLARRLELG